MRKIITLIHAHGLLSRAHGLLNRAHDLVIRAHDLVIRAHGLVIRAHGLIIRAHGLLSRAHGLARLNNYFPHGTAGAPYDATVPMYNRTATEMKVTWNPHLLKVLGGGIPIYLNIDLTK